MNKPICDIDSTHGEMRSEYIHHVDGTINTDYPMYWFCQVEGCDGYGGPVEKVTAIKRAKVTQEQPTLFNL